MKIDPVDEWSKKEEILSWPLEKQILWWQNMCVFMWMHIEDENRSEHTEYLIDLIHEIAKNGETK